MTEILIEIGLRLAKVAVALVLGVVAWAIVTGPLGIPGSGELALLCWLSGAALVLLVESSPI